MMMPRIRQRSGTCFQDGEPRQNLIRRFAGKLHIQRIGTQIDLVSPSDFVIRIDPYRFEEPAILPRLENSHTRKVRKIYLAFFAILKPDPNAQPFTRFDSDWLCGISAHGLILIQLVRRYVTPLSSPYLRRSSAETCTNTDCDQSRLIKRFDLAGVLALFDQIPSILKFALMGLNERDNSPFYTNR